MSFFDLLDGLLTTLDVPFYEGQPEFERSPPEVFVTYSVYDVPNLRGCGLEITTTYHVTVNIYATGVNRHSTAVTLDETLTDLLTENGFVRRTGIFGLSNDFPRYYHRVMEFDYDYERT